MSVSDLIRKALLPNEENKCTKCKRKISFTVICDKCFVFRYCSEKCLKDDHELHMYYCNAICLAKHFLKPVQENEFLTHLEQVKAEHQNDYGKECSAKTTSGGETEKQKAAVSSSASGWLAAVSSEVNSLPTAVRSGVGVSTEAANSDTGNSRTRMKLKDFYNDIKDAQKNLTKKMSKEEQSSSSRTTTESVVGASLKEGQSECPPTLGQCSHCQKKGSLLLCSRCQLVEYCDKNCQKAHYRKHKEFCRRKERFELARKNVPDILEATVLKICGSFEISPFLNDIAGTVPFWLFDIHIMVEICDVHVDPCEKYRAQVRDLKGNMTDVWFNSKTNVYHHLNRSNINDRMLPIHLSRCIIPGNFILLCKPRWHIQDGKRCINIEDLQAVHFIFMNI